MAIDPRAIGIALEEARAIQGQEETDRRSTRVEAEQLLERASRLLAAARHGLSDSEGDVFHGLKEFRRAIELIEHWTTEKLDETLDEGEKGSLSARSPGRGWRRTVKQRFREQFAPLTRHSDRAVHGLVTPTPSQVASDFVETFDPDQSDRPSFERAWDIMWKDYLPIPPCLREDLICVQAQACIPELEIPGGPDVDSQTEKLRGLVDGLFKPPEDAHAA